MKLNKEQQQWIVDAHDNKLNFSVCAGVQEQIRGVFPKLFPFRYKEGDWIIITRTWLEKNTPAGFVSKVKSVLTDDRVQFLDKTNKIFTIPEYLGYPQELEGFLKGRKLQREKFGSIERDFPFFIKPATKVKAFTGGIVENTKQLELLKHFDNIPDDMEVFTADIVNFISEYRVFVSNGKIYGIKHYKGDFTIFPHIPTVESMVRAYTNCPSAFTLDVGVTDSIYSTKLVEVNDMWAIGSYGLEGKVYALLCERRMKEILK